VKRKKSRLLGLGHQQQFEPLIFKINRPDACNVRLFGIEHDGPRFSRSVANVKSHCSTVQSDVAVTTEKESDDFPRIQAELRISLLEMPTVHKRRERARAHQRRDRIALPCQLDHALSSGAMGGGEGERNSFSCEFCAIDGCNAVAVRACDPE
jgi:hypothetical protein